MKTVPTKETTLAVMQKLREGRELLSNAVMDGWCDARAAKADHLMAEAHRLLHNVSKNDNR